MSCVCCNFEQGPRSWRQALSRTCIQTNSQAWPLFLQTSSFIRCTCVYSEHGTAGDPGAVAGVNRCWRMEGGLQGARSPFPSLGIACAPRHERSTNGLCLASSFGPAFIYSYYCHFFVLLLTFLFVRALFGKIPSTRTREARPDTLV